MRLLHVIHDLAPSGGGPPEHLLQLSRGYGELGVTLEVLTLDAPDAAYLTRYPFKVHALGPTTSTYGFSAEARRWLHENVRQYDAVIIDGLWLYLGLVVRNVTLAAGIPYLVFPHGMLDPWFREQYPLKHVKKQLFWWAAQYRIMRDASRIVFTTEAEQALAPRTFSPSRWRSAVVSLGTSRPPGDPRQQRAAFLEKVPAVRHRRFLLFLSRLHIKKGCDLLIKAFCAIAASHPDVDLVLAGPDPDGLRPGLESILQQGGLAHRVHWPGMVEGDVKWGAFRSAEAFILPSHQENFGIAIAEAIACRLPVLISNKINIWKYVSEDRTGFVEDDTEAGTIKLFERWLALSAEEKEAMAAQTDRSFDLRFSMSRCAASLRSLVEEAIAEQKGHASSSPYLTKMKDR